MNAFLGFAMLVSIIVGAASVAGIIFALVKHRPKNKWAVCMICSVIVFAASLCTYEVSTPKENRPAPSAATVQQEAPDNGEGSSTQEEPSPAKQQPICPVAGIGDTADLFSGKYGEGKDNGIGHVCPAPAGVIPVEAEKQHMKLGMPRTCGGDPL